MCEYITDAWGASNGSWVKWASAVLFQLTMWQWYGCYGYNSLKITSVATIAPPLVDSKHYNSFPFSPLWVDPLWLCVRASFTSLPRALPSWFPNDSAQLSVCLVSWRSCFNLCNTSAIPSLIGRNIFFILQNSSIFWTISSIREMRFIAIWSVPYRQFFCRLASDFSKQSGSTLLQRRGGHRWPALHNRKFIVARRTNHGKSVRQSTC